MDVGSVCRSSDQIRAAEEKWTAWKRPITGDNEVKAVEGPVMGAEAWPALSDARAKGNGNAGSAKSPHAEADDGEAVDGPQKSPMPLPPVPPPPPRPQSAMLGFRGTQKSRGYANGQSSNRPHPQNHHRHNMKRIPLPNGVPSFPGSLPYTRPLPQFQPVMPAPHMPAYEYPHLQFAPPRPIVEQRMGSPVHSPVSPVRGGTAGANKNFPPPRGEHSMWHPGVGNYPLRGPDSLHGPPGNANQMWYQGRAFNSNNINMQQSIGPQQFLRPGVPVEQFYASAPGFINAPVFSGPPHGFLYNSPEFFGGSSTFIPGPQPGHSVHHETMILMAKLRQQIEYYFSDENLNNDAYLISLFDSGGWVSISKIADFKRVKSMTSDISLILDALRSSNLIEIQGNLIRRNGDLSKWLRIKCQGSSSRSNASDSSSSCHDKSFSVGWAKDLSSDCKTVDVCKEAKDLHLGSASKTKLHDSPEPDSLQIAAGSAEHGVTATYISDDPTDLGTESVDICNMVQSSLTLESNGAEVGNDSTYVSISLQNHNLTDSSQSTSLPDVELKF